MLQLLYILAFTVLAFLAVGNLIRSLLTLGLESQRPYPRSPDRSGRYTDGGYPAHPELVDETGNMVDEPLLVMRSMTMEDMREKLDALYDDSTGNSDQARPER